MLIYVLINSNDAEWPSRWLICFVSLANVWTVSAVCAIEEYMINCMIKGRLFGAPTKHVAKLICALCLNALSIGFVCSDDDRVGISILFIQQIMTVFNSLTPRLALLFAHYK